MVQVIQVVDSWAVHISVTRFLTNLHNVALA